MRRWGDVAMRRLGVNGKDYGESVFTLWRSSWGLGGSFFCENSFVMASGEMAGMDTYFPSGGRNNDVGHDKRWLSCNTPPQRRRFYPQKSRIENFPLLIISALYHSEISTPKTSRALSPPREQQRNEVLTNLNAMLVFHFHFPMGNFLISCKALEGNTLQKPKK